MWSTALRIAIPYLIPHIIDGLRYLAKQTDNEIDDRIVGVILDNEKALIEATKNSVNKK